MVRYKLCSKGFHHKLKHPTSLFLHLTGSFIQGHTTADFPEIPLTTRTVPESESQSHYHDRVTLPSLWWSGLLWLLSLNSRNCFPRCFFKKVLGKGRGREKGRGETHENFWAQVIIRQDLLFSLQARSPWKTPDSQEFKGPECTAVPAEIFTPSVEAMRTTCFTRYLNAISGLKERSEGVPESQKTKSARQVHLLSLIHIWRCRRQV